MTDTEKIIREVTGYKPTSGLTRQAKLEEMSAALNGLSQSKWDKLPNSVQDWANAANKAVKHGEEIPEFSLPNGKDTSRKEKTAKPASKKANKPAVRTRPIGAQGAIKRLVLKNPRITTEELLEQCSKQGFSPTKFAASTIRAGMKNTLKIIQEEGIDVRKLKL